MRGFSLRKGTIGKLRLDVPWSRLLSEACSVEIEHLELELVKAAIVESPTSTVSSEADEPMSSSFNFDDRFRRQDSEDLSDIGLDSKTNPGISDLGEMLHILLGKLKFSITQLKIAIYARENKSTPLASLRVASLCVLDRFSVDSGIPTSFFEAFPTVEESDNVLDIIKFTRVERVTLSQNESGKDSCILFLSRMYLRLEVYSNEASQEKSFVSDLERPKVSVHAALGTIESIASLDQFESVLNLLESNSTGPKISSDIQLSVNVDRLNLALIQSTHVNPETFYRPGQANSSWPPDSLKTVPNLQICISGLNLDKPDVSLFRLLFDDITVREWDLVGGYSNILGKLEGQQVTRSIQAAKAFNGRNAPFSEGFSNTCTVEIQNNESSDKCNLVTVSLKPVYLSACVNKLAQYENYFIRRRTASPKSDNGMQRTIKLHAPVIRAMPAFNHEGLEPSIAKIDVIDVNLDVKIVGEGSWDGHAQIGNVLFGIQDSQVDDIVLIQDIELKFSSNADRFGIDEDLLADCHIESRKPKTFSPKEWTDIVEDPLVAAASRDDMFEFQKYLGRLRTSARLYDISVTRLHLNASSMPPLGAQPILEYIKSLASPVLTLSTLPSTAILFRIAKRVLFLI